MTDKLTGFADSKILSEWSTKYPYCTGTLVKCSDVYNVSYGKVLFIGKMGSTYTVLVQCNSGECLRYSNLKSVNVSSNTIILENTLIGQADESVLFEYCTAWKGESTWPVRVGNVCFYKQNPSEILSGAYEIEPKYQTKIVRYNDVKKVTLTSKQAEEFADNRGTDGYVEF